MEPLATRIDTDRLVLKVRGPESADVHLALMAEQGRAGGVTREAIAERLAEQRTAFDATGVGFLAIHQEGAEVGYCGLLVGRHTIAEPEIAYEVLRSAQGQGIATEAARALVAATWATGRDRLWATTRPGNLASLQVATKVGFVEDHRTVDEHGEVVHLVIGAA